MADCLCENFPDYNYMGSKRVADIEENGLQDSDEGYPLPYNKRIKREQPLTPPGESSYENGDHSTCSPYWEVEDYMVRGYESIQDVQYGLYDLTPEEEVERECYYDDGEVPRIDCEIEMT